MDISKKKNRVAYTNIYSKINNPKNYIIDPRKKLPRRNFAGVGLYNYKVRFYFKYVVLSANHETREYSEMCEGK